MDIIIDRRRVADQKHYKKCKAESRCVQCGIAAPRIHCVSCQSKHNSNSKKQYQALKLDVILHYGSQCVCCGETESKFLSIDHILNNGAEERKTLKVGTGVIFYAWLKRNKYPSGYQVLCHSCNQGKQSNKGICPHQQFNVFDVQTWPHS